ncbi:hypothetical protein RSOLAG22IIIB_04817 [Rhizoctonia solani]|uniref:Uncharacterized protein n=1 Tax=Rhizoctonia solani TaxID=456999 RepID=A0A0K6G037_9AGAM|nr:hypothetical protein RSOLAG22IIIB_04817 [Rhizoctonia solani]
MRYFILSAHGGIGYLAALRILGQDPQDVCTFLVPFNEAETWKNDPQLRPHIASKTALIQTGDAKNIDDVQRAWHVAEMGIDSECSGIEAVIISDVPDQFSTLKDSSAEELLAVLKCFPAYPYPPFKMAREPFAYSAKSRTSYLQQRLPPLYMPRSPSYSSRSPRLILVLPSRSLKRLHSSARGSKEEQAIAWATDKKMTSSANLASPGSASTPGTPIHADSHSIHSSYSTYLTLSKTGSLFPEEQQATSVCGGWLDPKHALIIRPAVLMRRRCRGDETGSSAPYRIQEEFTIRDGGGGWTISKRDVAHFIVAKALEEWTTWGGRKVRIAY